MRLKPEVEVVQQRGAEGPRPGQYAALAAHARRQRGVAVRQQVRWIVGAGILEMVDEVPPAEPVLFAELVVAP